MPTQLLPALPGFIIPVDPRVCALDCNLSRALRLFSLAAPILPGGQCPPYV